jgi:hypothetical protein
MSKEFKLPTFLTSMVAAKKFLRERTDVLPSERGEVAGGYMSLAQDVARKGEARVYRAVTVPASLGLNGINFSCLGKAWSAKMSGAEPQGLIPTAAQGGASRTIIIEGVAALESVDWAYGFVSYSSYGDSQAEISLLQDQPVRVEALHAAPKGTSSCGGNRYMAYRCQKYIMDPPILGNTGPAHEEWQQQCGFPEESRGLPTLDGYRRRR